MNEPGQEASQVYSVGDFGDSAKSVSGTPHTEGEQCDYLMVAAIDLGTSYSGYAFSFNDNKDYIRMNKNWGAEAGCSSFKTPTCVMVDSHKQFSAFGYDAQLKYSELPEEECQDYYLFERFKMKLHRGKGLNQSTMLESANGKKLPAMDIFAMALEYMKDHLLETVNQSVNGPIDQTIIRWVITVPAIWSDASKQFMREAAFKGGLIDKRDSKQLVIALEPEAASVYVRKLEIDRVSDQSLGTPEDLTIKSGTSYIVIDAGGGTLDITVHELLPDGHVKELHCATGGPFGGTKVDEEFVKLLKNVIGVDFIDGYRKSFPSQWLQFMIDFEKRKRRVNGNMCINLPYSLLECLKEKEKPIEQGVLKGFPDISVSSGILRLNADAVACLFKSVADDIVNHIKTLLQNPKLRDVEYFFCVGGFSESKYLKDALDKNFSQDFKLLIPEEASLAVVKGAIQFGQQPDVIISRVSARTYGVSSMREYKPSIDSPEKLIKLNNRLMSVDNFSAFIKKDEDIPFGYSVTHEFRPVSDETKLSMVKVYSSDSGRARYVTDEGVEHHANITVTWGDVGEGRTIKVTMTFGGTEIKVTAITFPEGKKVETKINFLAE